MRLIDADNLKLAIDEGVKTVSKEVGLSKQLTRILLAEFAHTVLNEAPTVKAIPIEWIKNYIIPFQVFHNSLSEETKENDGAGWVVDVLETMLREWEKENDKGSE